MISLSVIIPVYNTPHELLEDNINSLTSQQGEFELIYINDGSSDPWINDRLSLLSNNDSRVKYVCKKNTGVSDTRNIGISLSTKDYILFVDSDDTMTLDSFLFMSKKAEEKDVDILLCGFCLDKPISHVERRVSTEEKKDMLYASIAYRTHKYSSIGILIDSPWAKLFKRSLIIDNNIRFDVSLFKSEDALFDVYAYQHADSIYLDNTPVYNYVYNENSVCHTYSYRHIDAITKILDAEKKFVDTFYHNDQRLQDALAIRTVVAVMDASHSYFSVTQKDKSFNKIKQEYDELISSGIVSMYLKRVRYNQLSENGLCGFINCMKLFLYKRDLTLIDMLIFRTIHLLKK